MIIYAPTQVQVGAEVQLSAQIEFLGKKKRKTQQELWFRFPLEFQAQVSLEIDPFAVALLLLAMKNQEPMILKGSLSKKLFEGLKEYQKIYHSWFPETFHRIEIQPELLRDDKIQSCSPIDLRGRIAGESLQKAKLAACAFSGGVDSFYTFLKLREGTESPLATEKLGAALFMAGFDMPLNLVQSIAELTTSYQVMMKNQGIQFIVGSTNVRNFVNTVDWTNAHGQALAASALFFQNSWKNFYIPSSYSPSTSPKWGTHPALDHLLSTEAMSFIHHGTEANRVQKLKLISNFEESYSRLRVCWIQDIGLRNCGECEKCVRTMIALSILNRLPMYMTFESQALTRKKIRGLKMRTHQARIFARELIQEAARRRKWDICLDLGVSLLKREVFHLHFRWQKWRRSLRTET